MSAALEAWAMALAAPIRQRLGLSPTGLAGGRRPQARRGDRFCKQQLEGVASISDRRDLLAQLPGYLDHGSREEYARHRRWHEALPPEARSTGFYLLDAGERLKRVFIHDHIGRPEETSVAAWDVGRVVHYIGLGWGAGYLAEAEAWSAIARAARIALGAYASWQEYGRGFVYGRWFWAGYWAEGMKETAEAVERLLAPGGAWHDLPWPVDVDALEGRDGDGVAANATPTTSSWKAVRIFVDCPGCQLPVLIREVSTALRCDGCGESSELAARDGWRHGATPDDDDDEDEDEDEGGADDDDVSPPAAGALSLFTNLDDRIQRAMKAPAEHATCAGCGVAIAAAAVRAAAGAGGHRCGCGRATPIVVAPDWLRAIDARLRYVVGGPLTLGRPDGVLYLMTEEPGS